MVQVEYNGRDNLEVMQEAKNYNRFLLDLIMNGARGDELTVDFGAGNGTFSLPIAATGSRLVCVENDPVLSSILSGHGLNVVGSLESLNDCSVDYLYTLNVLEHIEDDEVMVDLWMRKLRPGGRLLVYVPAFEVLFSSMDRKVGHFRRYTKQGLRGKLERAGFRVGEIRYADSVGYLASLVYKAFDDGEGGINLSLLKTYDKWIFPISRALDWIASPYFGKNVYARAVKPL